MMAALAGCESTADVNRKPDMVAAAIDESVQVCKVSDPAVYKERLNNILMHVPTHDLDLFKENRITVCLDARLGQQVKGFLDRRMNAVYYAGALVDEPGKFRSIVSLWDNGQPLKKDGVLSLDASDYGSRSLEKLADSIESNGLPEPGENKIAGRYSYRSGKTTSYRIKWKSVENFDQGTVSKNPQLATPPTPEQW